VTLSHHVLVVAALVSLPLTAAAQRRHDAVWRGSQAETQRDIRPTHWVEGATIGAAVLGTTGAFLGYFLACEVSDDSSDCDASRLITGGLLGGVTGGLIGALVGGFIPAERERPLRGHPWKAAAIGAAVGTGWGFALDDGGRRVGWLSGRTLNSPLSSIGGGHWGSAAPSSSGWGSDWHSLGDSHSLGR
jgi:hypothetical protein